MAMFNDTHLAITFNMQASSCRIELKLTVKTLENAVYWWWVNFFFAEITNKTVAEVSIKIAAINVV